MLIRKPSDIPSSQITPETVWQGRRDWIARAGLAAAA
ncbi:protein-methionine-sulfoxide reductase catalytic subunit MsrP, partial [Bordetella pertussis]